MSGRFDRVRFYTEEHEDYRPVTVDDVGPWWCTGYAFDPDRAIIVAYVPTGRDVTEWWPEAVDIDVDETGVEPVFSGRFPRPEWWTESCT